jgi:hypothetical protein
MRNNRRHRRVEGSVFVEYRLQDDPRVQGISAVANVSTAGLRFGMDTAPPLHAPVELQIHIGRIGSFPIQVTGNVVWANPATPKASTPYEVGIAVDHQFEREMALALRRVYAAWRQARED